MKIKNGFTLAEENCQFAHSFRKFGRLEGAQYNYKAFTLAEVLITLAIIGVVAALTIPSVITNYRKNLYVTQLKKEYNYFTNAFHTAMARDGVTRLSDTKLWTSMPTVTKEVGPTSNPILIVMPTSADCILKNNAEEFKNALTNVFNIASIYDGDTSKLPTSNNNISYKRINGETISYNDSQYVAKESLCLSDGACFRFNFNKTPNTRTCNNQNCSSLKEFQEYYNTPTKLWQKVGNIHLDVNGFQKGPNQVGRDYFSFIVGNDGNLYPQFGIDDAVYMGDLYTDIVSNSAEHYWKAEQCNTNSSNNGGFGCAARIMEEGWKMNY